MNTIIITSFITALMVIFTKPHVDKLILRIRQYKAVLNASKSISKQSLQIQINHLVKENQNLENKIQEILNKKLKEIIKE